MAPNFRPPARLLSEHYPGFRPAGHFLDASESWIGTIRPFALCSGDDLLPILDDLDAGGDVLLQNGSLLHDPACQRRHRSPSYRNGLGDIGAESFCIKVIVWPPPVHPKAISIFPEISSAVFPNQPHLFRPEPRAGLPELPTLMPDALCAYRPGDGEWSWRLGDLVLFLDFVAIYLAKHAVWVRTGADNGGVWIGPHASHAPRDLITQLDPLGECRCGSGDRYRDCHLAVDQARAAGGRAA